DTATPLSMAQSFQQLALGNALGNSQRELFQSWLKQSQTGFKRIRASVPKDWIVGDKTGSGGGKNGYGVTNDVAILWPPKHAPLIISIYFVSHDPNADVNDAAVANAAKIVITALSAQDASFISH
ncbi:MAG: serine hydrolase, partial [Gammaproteobacteria bacterium]|nr:serine hydrolase [Gammaproteobacteria bacterium]